MTIPAESDYSDYESEGDKDYATGDEEKREKKAKKKKSKKKKSSSRSLEGDVADDELGGSSSHSKSSKKMKKSKSSRSMSSSGKKKKSKKSKSSRKMSKMDSESSFLSDPESFRDETMDAPASPDRRGDFAKKSKKKYATGSESDLGSYKTSNSEWEMDKSVREFASSGRRRAPRPTKSGESLDSMASSDAMTDLSDYENDPMYSTKSDRRRELKKTGSARSMDSDDKTFTSARSGAMSMRSLFNRGGSARSLERDKSWVERREKRLMMKEKRSLLKYRQEQLRKKIIEEGGPRWNFMLAVVTLLTASELGLDLGTTILSLVSMLSSFTCCGEEVEVGSWLVGVTIPYSFLVTLEFVILGLSIKQARANTARDKIRFKQLETIADDEEWFSDEEESSQHKREGGRSAASQRFHEEERENNKVHWGGLIHYVLLLNPFLGCLIAWFLLYEVADKREAFIILGLEGGAVMLMFITGYLRRDKMSFNTLLIHALPLVSDILFFQRVVLCGSCDFVFPHDSYFFLQIPLSVTCAMIWYYLQNGGICYRQGNFQFEGCELCSERDPTPAVGDRCWNGAIPYDGTFCGDTVESRFCYYSYED